MIYITNHEDSVNFHKHLKKEEYNVMVRITDSNDSFKQLEDDKYYNGILELKFNDITEKDINSFNKKHLDLLNDFFESHKNNDNIVFHCQAGISRSSACAVGYCMYKNNEEGMLKIFGESRYYPNDLICEMFADLYKYDKEKLKELIKMNRDLPI